MVVWNISVLFLLKACLSEKHPFSFRKHELDVFISYLHLVDSFPCLWFMIMFMITNFIETRTGKLLLGHLIGNNNPEFHNGLLDSYFFKPTLGSCCLKLCFWAVTFKTILTLIVQIYQSLSGQSFKHSSANMPSSNSQPAFTC